MDTIIEALAQRITGNRMTNETAVHFVYRLSESYGAFQLLPQDLGFTRVDRPASNAAARNFEALEIMQTLLRNTRRQRSNGTRPRNGFTLMELLIVISIMLILMLMAIPNFNKMRITAHETSAINSLKQIYTAQIQYQTTFPQNGYSSTLQALGGDPKQGNPTPTSAQLLQGDLPAGIKDGYIFAITNITKVTVNNVDQVTGYDVTAVPQAVGKTGNRGFCIDTLNEVKVDPQGGTNCTQAIQ